MNYAAQKCLLNQINKCLTKFFSAHSLSLSSDEFKSSLFIGLYQR